MKTIPELKQHRVVAKVEELMTLCDSLKAQLQSANREVQRALRQSLLKYKLRTNHDLFEKAYAYIEQYY